MQLRRRLLIYTLLTLLPLVLFSVVAMVLVARHERGLYERSARERTLALLTAVDAELEGHFVTLRALATSRALEQGDLAAFREEALRTLAVEPRWNTVRLSRPSGRRILDTAVPPGAPLPSFSDDTVSFEDVVTRRRPTVGAVLLDPHGHRHVFHVRIPLMRRGELTGVLSALVDPESIVSMLRMQRLPESWVGVVLDRDRRIVARTLRHAATVGMPAADGLRGALEAEPSGWFRGETLEGVAVYTPFNRSSFSQWTVAMGIPVEDVEAGALRTAWMLALGVLFATGAAIALAAALGRQITRPIGDLRNAANTLARGDPVDDGGSAGVDEVDEVRHALANASRIVREREAALRTADRAKDEFLAMLGHELRNPLSAIASAAQILKLPEAGRAAIAKASSIVGRQVDHMTRLVDDLLDVGRVTSGRVQLARQRFDLSTRVAAALEGLRSTGRLSAHTLRTRLEPVWIEADEARIEQIVVNLVGNAIKYTPPGGRVEVRVGREGSDAVIEVIDDGQGLSPELLPRVFDLFVQGERSLDRSEGGLGIGLTLVKRLVELHGGTTQATSEGEGCGARFVVRLPAVIAPPPDKQLIPTELDVPPLRILVIEDNEDARDALVGALALRGHATSGAADGPSGLARAAELAPDLIVVDIGLPGLDGCEVARRLRALPLGGSGILIALSGYGQAEMRERALASGFDAYLVKPVTARALLQRVATLRSTRERVDDRS